MIAALHQFRLLFETCPLFKRIIEFTVCIGNFFAIDHELKTLHQTGFASVLFRERAHLDWIIGNESWLNEMLFTFIAKNLINQL